MTLTRNEIRELQKKDIEERLVYQDSCLARIIGNSAIVPANGSVELAIQISQEGDFMCREIRGRIIPSDAATYYGISARMTDNSKVEIIQNCSLDSILSPGYGIGVLQSTEMVHLFERGGVVRFMLSNATAVDQTVWINLLGERLR